MACWVGAYVEAGASVSGGNSTPYLAFPFCGPTTRADAEKQAAAKLLAGPFATNAEASKWADSYNRNPNTVQAGSGLSPSTGTTKAGAGQPPGASAIPALTNGIPSLGQFINDLSASSTWLRVAKVIIGGGLLLFALAHMTGADNAAATVIKRLPLPV